MGWEGCGGWVFAKIVVCKDTQWGNLDRSIGIVRVERKIDRYWAH